MGSQEKQFYFEFDDLLLCIYSQSHFKEVLPASRFFSLMGFMFNIIESGNLEELKKTLGTLDCNVLVKVKGSRNETMLQAVLQDPPRFEIASFFLDKGELSKCIANFSQETYVEFLSHFSANVSSALILLIKKIEKDKESPELVNLFKKLIDLHSDDFDLNEELCIDGIQKTTLLHQLISHGQTSLVKYMTDHEDIDLNKKDGLDKSPLMAAFEYKVDLTCNYMFSIISNKLFEKITNRPKSP